MRVRLRERSSALSARALRPTLAIIIAGADPSSEAYSSALEREGERCGVQVRRHTVAADVSTADLRALLASLGADAAIHGMLLQQPLPTHLHVEEIVDAIPAEKDVDGASPLSQGRLAQRAPGAAAPATPQAVMLLLERSSAWPLRGKRVTVVGKSPVVGLPAALLLMHANATVTVTHKDTRDLKRHLRDAEVVVTATGVPGLIRGDMLSPGVVVIDVGTAVVDGRILGDVDEASVARIAGEMTPVPGGVGPVTNVALMSNVIVNAERSPG